jgi:uncharacterized membrane protein YdjX (TVP38/TMEM64 family)
VQEILNAFSNENLTEMFQTYRAFGPFIAILLPFVEAFLPFLPLVVFVVANTNSFGLWQGFILSWIGSASGAFCVFFLVRRFGQKRLLGFICRHRTVRRLMHWVERRGFGPLFLLLCFPFTPSSAVNVVAGLSKVGAWQFFLAVCAGKLVMIFVISFIGYDLQALITQPIRSIIAALVIFLLWIIGKRLEQKLHVKFVQRENEREER